MKKFVPYLKGDNTVPGVADSIRKTNLLKEKNSRKQEMTEILRMIEEDRLHEADERQLENLKLALELKDALTEKTTAPNLDLSSIADVVRNAIADTLEKLPVGNYPISPPTPEFGSRPAMKHTSLGDLQQTDSGIKINNIQVEELSSDKDDAVSKLEKLKKLKHG